VKRRLASLVTAVVLAVGVPVLTAPAAHAGDCVATVLCGQVHNGSRIVIQISNAWHDYPGSPRLVEAADKHNLYPGETSNKYPAWKDTDAVWWPAPCYWIKGQIKGGVQKLNGNTWYKLGDLDYWNVQLSGC
jgi:hypothetical protein